MGVYIKGMEMPKRRDTLVLIKTDGQAIVYEDEPYVTDAVYVPPHGRLIDADALDEAFTDLRWDDKGLAHWGDRKDWCMQGREIETLLANAPTIIPTEEGE